MIISVNLYALNLERRNVICFIQGISPYRTVNTTHRGYKNQKVNDVYSKAAVCSEIRAKHSTQSEHDVEFLDIKPGVT